MFLSNLTHRRIGGNRAHTLRLRGKEQAINPRDAERTDWFIGINGITRLNEDRRSLASVNPTLCVSATQREPLSVPVPQVEWIFEKGTFRTVSTIRWLSQESGKGRSAVKHWFPGPERGLVLPGATAWAWRRWRGKSWGQVLVLAKFPLRNGIRSVGFSPLLLPSKHSD